MSATMEVQKAIVAALKADATFGGLAGDRIYDRTPDSATDPYSQIVAVDERPAIETQDSEGADIVVTLHVWGTLRPTVQAIMDAQRAVIHNAELALDTETNVFGREVSATTRTAEKPWVQGIQRFRFLTHP